MPSFEESKAKVLAAAQSPDPIGSILGPAANSYRLDIRKALAARRPTRLPSYRPLVVPQAGVGEVSSGGNQWRPRRTGSVFRGGGSPLLGGGGGRRKLGPRRQKH